METRYFVVAAPGYYGDKTRVVSSHATRETAIKAAAKGNYVARVGAMRKGEIFLRHWEGIYSKASEQ